jgi:glycosyltransferase involved in cell wall biosynthesis
LKILHIIDSGGLYGAEVMLINLIAEQIKLGLDPTIASIGKKSIHEKQLETEAMKRDFKVKKFRMRPGPNYLGAMKILKYANKKGFNILHSHGYKGNILIGLLPRKIRKIPIVSTLHGWTSTNGFSKMHLYEWLDRKSLKHIDSVVLVSNAMKSHPKLKGLKGINFHVISNGIPIPEKRVNESTTQQFNQSTTQSTQQTQATQNLDSGILNFCSKGFTIGSIGRLSKEKGYKYLIEALALLIKKGIDVRLIIIGEGDERGSLVGLITKAELSDHVLMPGYIDDAKRYISLFNVFILSSLTEGLPITLLEAMQAKIPIVATNIGGIPEVLQNGKAGFVISPGRSKVLAESIDRIHSHTDLADKFINNAYQRVSTCYASKTMATKYFNVYNRLLNN